MSSLQVSMKWLLLTKQIWEAQHDVQCQLLIVCLESKYILSLSKIVMTLSILINAFAHVYTKGIS